MWCLVFLLFVVKDDYLDSDGKYSSPIVTFPLALVICDTHSWNSGLHTVRYLLKYNHNLFPVKIPY